MADKDDLDSFKVELDEHGRRYVRLSSEQSLFLKALSVNLGLSLEAVLALGHAFADSPGLLAEIRELARTNKAAARERLRQIISKAQARERRSDSAN